MKKIFDISVMTCVRDPRKTGGGVPKAALPVHSGISRMLAEHAILVTGWPPEDEQTLAHPVGKGGSGFKSFQWPSSRLRIMHIHGLWTPFEVRASSFANQNNFKLIISPHGMLEPWALKHKKLKKLIAWYLYQRRILLNADLFIVNSFMEYETVRRKGLTAPVAVIENGVDVDGSNQITQTQSRESIVLFLSRLSPVKGIPDLLKAWACLADKNGYELHLYGNPDPGYETVVNSIVDRLGLKESVKVCGPAFGEDKWLAYRSAKVFVLPSYSENFGIVVAEAMLAGLPVITTSSTPWSHLADGGMGWIVDNDVNQLRKALREAIELSDEQRYQMGVKAQEYAREHFLWEKVLPKYAETYAWAAGVRIDKPSWIFCD